MKTIESLIPGSPDWLQSRSASKAPAMMGVSKYQTRSDLLKQMATGIKEDVDAATQARFDAGHASEAAAREIAEDILCDGLSPVCGESDDGYLTASFDGRTFDGKIGFEHKLWNETLVAAVRADELPEEYKVQMDQQILVGGLEYVLFMVSDGTRDKCVSMEYRSTPERAAKLLAAWKQFDIDLAAYQHTEAAPVAVAAPINELPALMVEIAGSVTASNLAQWKEIVTERIAGINTDLQTDTDFANADAMVKFLDDGEKRIDLVKSQAQANAADIDRVFRALDEIKASMRAKRLELDKLVTKRKESIKIEIMQAGKDQLAAHIAGLGKRIDTMLMPPISADWAGAIKGKRNLESMRGAVADLVAAKKIESNEIADRITINLNFLSSQMRQQDVDYTFLFSDYAALVMKAPDDLAPVIKMRIDDEDKRRIAENERILEAEREKMRREEEAKATAKAKAEQEEAERQRKAAEEAAAKIERDCKLAAEALAEVKAASPMLQQITEHATQPDEPIAVTQAIIPPATAAVASIDNGRYLRLGEINSLLGFTVTSEFLAGLGFVATQEKSARMYRECDFQLICRAIVEHIATVASVPTAMRRAAA